ncbi:MAG: hypothetical protein [Microviridae sp.]|nr:MAG: hypothetical protein [Microviridae sp.]
MVGGFFRNLIGRACAADFFFVRYAILACVLCAYVLTFCRAFSCVPSLCACVFYFVFGIVWLPALCRFFWSVSWLLISLRR